MDGQTDIAVIIGQRYETANAY